MAEKYDIELKLNIDSTEIKAVIGEVVEFKNEINSLLTQIGEDLQKTLNVTSARDKATEAKIVAQERNSALEKLKEIKDTIELENNLNKAKIEGNTEEIERLETQKRIREVASQIIEAGKAACKNSNELTTLEKIAQEVAAQKVKLEKQALDIEKERATQKEKDRDNEQANLKAKQKEQSIEDYNYRVKVARAKYFGDDKELARLKEERETNQEVEALVGQGFEHKDAEYMVRKTRNAEKIAREKEASNSASTPQEPKGKTKKIPVTVSKKYLGKYEEFQSKKARGELSSTASWEEFRTGGKKTKIDPIGNYRKERQDKAKAKQPPSSRTNFDFRTQLNLGKDNIQPPAPPKNKNQTDNPANDAGGKTDDDKKTETIKILSANQDILKNLESLTKNVEQNTAAIALKIKE